MALTVHHPFYLFWSLKSLAILLVYLAISHHIPGWTPLPQEASKKLLAEAEGTFSSSVLGVISIPSMLFFWHLKSRSDLAQTCSQGSPGCPPVWTQIMPYLLPHLGRVFSPSQKTTPPWLASCPQSYTLLCGFIFHLREHAGFRRGTAS